MTAATTHDFDLVVCFAGECRSTTLSALTAEIGAKSVAAFVGLAEGETVSGPTLGAGRPWSVTRKYAVPS